MAATRRHPPGAAREPVPPAAAAPGESTVNLAEAMESSMRANLPRERPVVPPIAEVLAAGYATDAAESIIAEQELAASIYDRLLAEGAIVPAPAVPSGDEEGDPEDPGERAPPERFIVRADRRVSIGGLITVITRGSVVDPRHYDIQRLREQGVELDRVA